MIKKTFKELVFATNTYNDMLKERPEIQNMKFGYAWNKFYRKNLDLIFKEYNSEVADMRITNALTNKETGEILFERESLRGFKFSPEKLKTVIKKEREIEDEWNIKEFEVESFICSEGPILNDTQREAFEGLIVPLKKDESTTS